MAIVSHAQHRTDKRTDGVCYTFVRNATGSVRRVRSEEFENRMGLLRSVVDTVIGNMTPEERVEAIREVAAQAINLMTPDERKDLANTIFAELTRSMTTDERRDIAARLDAETAPAGEN
ncbi:MAG: hypothetical protein M3Z19_02515 [Chloroflexota bacterium]|nr:hypothetical protein [Chloroflexota bacterium]